MSHLLKAQRLFNQYHKANRPARNETYEEHKKEYERAKFEFATYMYQLAFQGKLMVKTDKGLRYVSMEFEHQANKEKADE